MHGADDVGGGVPRVWRWVLGWTVPQGMRDSVLGDAAEEFRTHVVAAGRKAAVAWYRRQAVRSVLPGLAHRLWAARQAWRQAEREVERMGAWMRDFRLAFRSMTKRAGFSATVLVTLALGIGATTALFGVYRAVFMEPIDLPASDELVIVMEQGGFGCCGPASGPDYLDWVERNHAFADLLLQNVGRFTLSTAGDPERVRGMRVTASAFPMLRVEPLMGRTLLPEDEAGALVVLVSYSLWQDQLAANPDVLGTSLELDGTGYTIVGVMPEGFDVPSPWTRMGSNRVYLPFEAAEISASDRGNHGWPVVARLAPGHDKESAQADMDRIMRELAAEYPQTNGDRSTKLFTVHEYLFGTAGKQLGLILGAAAIVLLIACGNVAGLLLARAAGRETELAVRAALGASRRAMVRLLFSEALLLALVGGVLGLLVSVVAIDGLKALLPPTIPRIDQIRVDGWALVFALGASGFTALVFGMVPALVASRTNLASTVKEGGYATLAPTKERLRNAFIVGQIALGLVLTNGAVLLVRSYAAVRNQDFGFTSEGIVTMSINPAGPRYEDDQAYTDYFDEVIRRAGRIPAVQSVGVISRLPLFGGSNGSVWVEGTPPRQNAGEGPLVEVTSVTGDYFATLGIPLLKGRLLQSEDSTTAAPGVVINQRFAELAWPDQDPLGKRFSFEDEPPEWITVVGVVGNVRQWGPEQPPQAQLYAPYSRRWSSGGYLTVRASADLNALVPEIRKAVLAADPAQPPSDVQTMEARMDRTFAQRRFYTTLIALFALAALLLSAAGVYGTVSYFVARRVRELGIRMALGARGTGIMGLVVRRGVRLAAWGVTFGLGGVWASTRIVEGLVYGIGAVDWATLVAGCVALAVVAVTASAIPAARALRVTPVAALRSE